MTTRPVHPRVAEMIQSGDLVLAPGTDPADVGYIEFRETPPDMSSLVGAGQLHLTACALTLDVRRRLIKAQRTFVQDLVQAMLEPVAEHQLAVPEVVYRHCGRRRCTGCDRVFLSLYPTRAEQRAADALTREQRRARRAERRRRWRSLRPCGSTKPSKWH